MSQNPADRLITLAAMPDGTPEIFTSVQGEGPRTGMLSLFVRLSECNLFCRWCDTAYTWRWSAKHEHEDNIIYGRTQWQVKVPVRELAGLIKGSGPGRVIFTGGEPLLQHRALLPLLRELRAASANFEFEFETNGTIAPPPEFLDLCSLVVVSPKLSNSGMEPSVRIVEALARLLEAPQVVLKFVVESEQDFEEIGDLRRRFQIAAHRIWIMPRGRTAEAVAQTGQAVVGKVIASGYNYSQRLHLSLFGDKQGT
ncbi:MAG: 7-carboxy-7-deazaguanine synthase QueE [Acidobacteria bacterium]|nr:7-carboxy-7-deazaguanine synthase QueE [Acidobacteriota bacterium]